MLLWSRGEQKVKEVVIDGVTHTQDNELLSFQELTVLFRFLVSYSVIFLFGYWPHLLLSLFQRRFNSHPNYSNVSRLINRLISNKMFCEIKSFAEKFLKRKLLQVA